MLLSLRRLPFMMLLWPAALPYLMLLGLRRLPFLMLLWPAALPAIAIRDEGADVAICRVAQCFAAVNRMLLPRSSTCILLNRKLRCPCHVTMIANAAAP